MKKLCALLIALAMVFALVACSSSDDDSASDTEEAAESASEDASASESADAGESADASASETSSSGRFGEAQYGGSITLYYTDDIQADFDPTISDNAGYNLWMETLFTYDVALSGVSYDLTSTNVDTSVITGQLADSWEWDEDAGTFTVHLREDVYFQDKEPYNGRQFVANDVKWTYDRVLGIGSGWDEPYPCTTDWYGDLNFVEEIETDGDFTVIFHFNEEERNELALGRFMTTPLCIGGPEWDDLTDDQKSSVEYASGTGPYILESLVANVSATLVKNDNYYGTDSRAGYEGNPLPYLDEIDFVYIADSTNTVVQFISGDLDFIGGRADVLNDSEIAQLENSDADYRELSLPLGRTEVIMLRCNSEPFSDINVRKALQNAIDLEAIMRDYYGIDLTISGLYSPTEEYAYHYEDWSDDLKEQYAYDPDRCLELLAEAGYEDGLEFTVVISPDNDLDLFTYIQSEYFAPLNITMNLEVVSNFMEAKSVGNDEFDTRSTAGTGLLGSYASYKRTGARTYTLDGSWGGAMWTHDEVWADMLDESDTAKTFDELYAYAREQDEYFLEQHWAAYMSGVKEVHEYYSGRLNGLSEGDRLYNPSYMRTLLMHMWVDY